MDSKLFLKYIRNYLGTLGILLILMIPVYMTIYQGTKEQILSNTYNKLEQGVMDLDSRIIKMRLITDVLRSDADVATIANIKGTPVANDATVINRVQRLLISCLALSMEDTREYVVFRDNSVVITKGAVLSDPFYHNYSEYEQRGMKYEQFQQYIFEDDKALIYLPKEDGQESVGIVCILKGPGNIAYACDTALIFELNQDMINEILSIDMDSQIDFAYVTDYTGEILYQVNFTGEPLLKDSYKEQKINRDGQKYTLLHVDAESCGLSWTVGISNKTIAQGINNVNRIIGIYIIVAVLLMIAFCIYFAVQRAIGMHGVLQSLRRVDSGEKRIKNELRYVAGKIDDLCEENEGYRIRIDKLQQSISNSMLEKLVLRGVYSAREKEEIQTYLHWNMEFYCVICVSTKLKQQDDILDCFYKIDDYMNNYFDCIPMSVGKNERTYIVHMGMKGAPDTRDISDTLKKLLQQQKDIRIGISTIGTGLENIQLCYEQAKLVVRQIMDLYDTSMAEYHEQLETKDKIFKLNLGNRIYDLILAKEKNTLKELFEKIRSYAGRSLWVTEQERMQFFFEIQNPIARVWDEIDRSDEGDKEFPAYQSDKTMVELIDALEDTSCYLCDCIVSKKQNNKNAFYNEMIQFVEDNYTNNEMCVTYIADHLGISDKYFITLFKEQTGRNFAAYVESKRMQKAEEYLLETDWSMAKIAETVGYNSVDTFYRSFKKVYGVAPGKWKENRK